MLTSSLQSAPCATADAANDMLNGMLLAFGKGQEIKIISMDAHEVEGGLWVATAFFEISDPAPVEEDEEEKGPREEKTETDKFKMNDDNDVALWHGLTHQQEPEIPAGRDIPELKDIDYTQPELPVLAEDKPSEDRAESDSLTGLSDSEIKLSENLQTEFQKVEEAANDVEPDASYIPVAGEAYSDDRTYEERLEKAKREADEEELERLKRMRDELMALQDAPTVDPAPPQG